MTWYLQFNLALSFFGLMGLLVSRTRLSSRQKIKIQYLLMILVLLVMPVIELIPEANYQYPVRDVIQAPMGMAIQGFNKIHNLVANTSVSEVISYNIQSIPNVIFFIAFIILCIIPYKTIKTYKEIKSAFLHKSIGNIKVLISNKKQSPYSFSLLNKAYVVLPSFLLEDVRQFQLALKHELQHIKNRDTFWVYIFELVVSICFLNPIVYLWRKQVLLDQEFACDESLIAQCKVQPRAYANCILQVAELTSSHNIPYGVTGMAWGKMKSQLLWRIVKMKEIKRENKNLFTVIVALSVMLFATSVFALHSPVRSLTLSELKSIVNVNDFKEFPIELNDRVLTELNRFLSNGKWKEFTRQSLLRYEDYKELIDAKAKQYHLPTEIAAIAFIETGFKNLPDRSTSVSLTGAGMWQFIPTTARRFDLKVSEEADDRMIIPKATDAAMRYLAENFDQFKDLRLAIMSYYVGEGKVHEDIKNYGTSNPWVLIENGNYKTPYLARAMAGAILLKYPSLIK